ncbi:MAG: hypothetical protein J0H51_19200 [Rhizobiales bacterium]|nr:hypothetical protein [Hyphomicrobiales bacterium]MBN9002784.1 hypothetical protein [Hyphomicrobiales bacterium]
MMQTRKHVASAVAEIDEVRSSIFGRNPDRPDGRFVRSPVGGGRDVAKARQRLRTAAWRRDNDAKGRPTSDQIGRALLMAVVTSPDFADLVEGELTVVRRALNSMQSNGFDLAQTQDVMRRLRRRHSNAVDRDAEAGDVRPSLGGLI